MPPPPTEPDAPVRDPGAQPERTRLAWRRTTLSFAIVAVLAVRLALHQEGSAAAAVGAALGLLALVAFLAVAQRRIRAVDRPAPEVQDVRVAVGAAACVAALALFGAVMVL
ncbi:DUF202 domain-containing protein [Streptomyces sp. A7024]|uniref:DUF202 domain-containing protein n=1 Tax=Streptomyces coryli TaxID=1128680 RepID=A0A6G4U4J4_9ACTN|nr:DUF202 domain-containing protein [Streptomyces coryli]